MELVLRGQFTPLVLVLDAKCLSVVHKRGALARGHSAGACRCALFPVSNVVRTRAQSPTLAHVQLRGSASPPVEASNRKPARLKSVCRVLPVAASIMGGQGPPYARHRVETHECATDTEVSMLCGRPKSTHTRARPAPKCRGPAPKRQRCVFTQCHSEAHTQPRWPTPKCRRCVVDRGRHTLECARH